MARVAVALCIGALVATSVTLFWAGASRNAQVTALRTDGVPVTVTVTGCQGLMGGSGSNLVGYSCTGTFSLGGQRHDEVIPGSSVYSPGTKLALVTQRSDPGVLATPSSVAQQRATPTVFIAPAALLVVALGSIGVALGRRRKSGGTLA